MELLFSYGTLRDPKVQVANFGRELSGVDDSLTGFVKEMLAISDPQVLATSGQSHHPIIRPSGNSEDEIAGVVFEVSSAELSAADSYEVADYRRTRVTLKSGKRAWVYINIQNNHA